MATFHRILFSEGNGPNHSGQMGTRGVRTGFLLLQTLRSVTSVFQVTHKISRGLKVGERKGMSST